MAQTPRASFRSSRSFWRTSPRTPDPAARRRPDTVRSIVIPERAGGCSHARADRSRNAGGGGRTLAVRYPGRIGYQPALELQATLVERRRRGEIPDTLLLLEHPHVITLGSSGRVGHVLLPSDELARRGIAVHEAGRGGDVTYHGPGQLVGYPILDLKPDRRDLHRYLRSLEGVLIRALGEFGLVGERDRDATGVWIGGAKVAAIGLRVSSGWITSHGFALNADTDLSHFDAIVPCGLRERPVTSISRLLRRRVTPELAAPAVVSAMTAEFGYGSVDDPGGANSK
ncbi:MAG: lipoyl(octanoyl) transferase LipB [Gemmatimonadetes bacterium]|nr:lipoyl(octanoyl) transferase LipB [Gemmatimonadota bacterium]